MSMHLQALKGGDAVGFGEGENGFPDPPPLGEPYDEDSNAELVSCADQAKPTDSHHPRVLLIDWSIARC